MKTIRAKDFFLPPNLEQIRKRVAYKKKKYFPFVNKLLFKTIIDYFIS